MVAACTLMDAYQLFADATVVLSEIEHHGMRIDTEYLERAIDQTNRRISDLTHDLREDEVYQIMRKRYGASTNLASRPQVQYALFDVLGYECKSYTKKGNRQLDVNTLEGIDHPFVQNYISLERANKLRSTYLAGIQSEVVDGWLHPVFNLHTVKTYRGSSDRINFQNIPARDPVAAELIRRCFIPRDGHMILEIDESGAEVRVGACYHQDPTMLGYIADPTTDMHRDMAKELFFLDEVPKPIRNAVKGLFVFAQFYGDVYTHCASGLWDAIDRHKLKTAEGMPLKTHLANHGIDFLGECDPQQEAQTGSFEKHVKEVSRNFWDNRFAVYAKWKRDWFSEYRRTGMMKYLSGFEVRGVFRFNEAVNYPIQGSAFHCMLWAMVQIHREMKRRKYRTRIIGQIHDSIVFDAHPAELQDVLQLAKYYMTEAICGHWPWVIVPLEVEAECTEVDQAWFYKKKVAI